jgi:hypothetical protein
MRGTRITLRNGVLQRAAALNVKITKGRRTVNPLENFFFVFSYCFGGLKRCWGGKSGTNWPAKFDHAVCGVALR